MISNGYSVKVLNEWLKIRVGLGVKVKQLFAIAASSLFVLTGCSSSPIPEPQAEDSPSASGTYKTCDELNLDYLGGISKVGALNSGSLPLAEWIEDDELYESVSFLDDDRDGIACELLKLTPELKELLAQQGESEEERASSSNEDEETGEGSPPPSNPFRMSERLTKEGQGCQETEQKTIGALANGMHGWLICDAGGKWVAFGGDLFEGW